MRKYKLRSLKILLSEKSELEKLKEDLPRRNGKKNKQEQMPKIIIEKKMNQTQDFGS